MFVRTTLAATVAAFALITATGCAVTRGQETVGAYIDDTTITTQVKSRFVDSVLSTSGTRISGSSRKIAA